MSTATPQHRQHRQQPRRPRRRHDLRQHRWERWDSGSRWWASSASIVALAGLLVWAGTAARASWASATQPGALPERATTDLGVSLALWTVAAISAWAALILVVAAGAGLPGRAGAWCVHVARAITPRMARGALAAVAGGAIGLTGATQSASATPLPASATLGGAIPAYATASLSGPMATEPMASAGPAGAVVGLPVGSASDPTGATGPGPLPDPSFRPTRPAAAAVSAQPVISAPRPSLGSDDTVVVHRGDTLWTIVARHLGPGASDAEIATAWPAWHAANRSVIGADPSLIRPGQLLHPPAAGQVG